MSKSYSEELPLKADSKKHPEDPFSKQIKNH